jgi:hypothetical protein
VCEIPSLKSREEHRLGALDRWVLREWGKKHEERENYTLRSFIISSFTK